MTNQTFPAGTAILRRKDVIKKTGLSRSSIYHRISTGTFPKQIHLGGNIVGWLESDVEEWIASHVRAGRNS